MTSWVVILHSGKLSREKTLVNFEALWLFSKVFFTKFGCVAFVGDTSEQSMKVFLQKSFIFCQFAKVFSFDSFSLYGNYTETNVHTGLLNTDYILSTVPRETFEGENFREFRGFVAICKSFLRKIWGVASFGTAKESNPRKFSPWKLYFSPIRESFLSQKFPAITQWNGPPDGTRNRELPLCNLLIALLQTHKHKITDQESVCLNTDGDGVEEDDNQHEHTKGEGLE